MAVLTLFALALAAAQPGTVSAPSEIVAAAPAADWIDIAAADILVMDLAPDRDGNRRRVVIQLMPPPFSQGWVGNIRKLAAAHWWDGTSINRVQDNYVVQWGDADGEDKAKAKTLPSDLSIISQLEYTSEVKEPPAGEIALMETHGLTHTYPTRPAFTTVGDFSFPDIYASGGPILDEKNPGLGAFSKGWPTAIRVRTDAQSASGRLIEKVKIWPVHCYGMVGVGRDLPPDTGTGAELYTVIGHAPRHLDRNIALVGRVVAGIEHLSSLPRGTGPLGFYEGPGQRVTITSVRLGNEVADLPRYQYLSTESPAFARYADARANRRDAFFVVPAGGADICNIPVPIRTRP